MSGHSKWSTIKRQKAVNDSARGKVFSKLSRAISIAVKTGNGADPTSNYKLRMVIDAARVVNMPKENIERAISKAAGESQNLEEVTYEGFGPFGIGVLVEVATDNRNRTAPEVKALFERGGGTFAGPGAVSFNFTPMGYIQLEKTEDTDGQLLSVMDADGVEDVEVTADGVDVYTSVSALSEVNKFLADKYSVKKVELIKRPKTMVRLSKSDEIQRAISFLEMIEDHDDVQKVFTNVEFSDEQES